MYNTILLIDPKTSSLFIHLKNSLANTGTYLVIFLYDKTVMTFILQYNTLWSHIFLLHIKYSFTTYCNLPWCKILKTSNLTFIRETASSACIIRVVLVGWPSETSCVEPKYRARNRTPSINTAGSWIITVEGKEY